MVRVGSITAAMKAEREARAAAVKVAGLKPGQLKDSRLGRYIRKSAAKNIKKTRKVYRKKHGSSLPRHKTRDETAKYLQRRSKITGRATLAGIGAATAIGGYGSYKRRKKKKTLKYKAKRTIRRVRRDLKRRRDRLGRFD